MTRTSLLLILIALGCTTTFAQSKRKKKTNDIPEDIRTANTQQPTALSPSQQKKEYVPKTAKKKRSSGPTFTAEAKFYERMEEVERARAKEEKLKEKPQYSDPMYFGHKRPPKKRKPGKMKYCKECGIRH